MKTDERMSAHWIKKLEDENINWIQRKTGMFEEWGDEARVYLQEFDAGEEY